MPTIKRKSLDEYMMEMARTISTRSTCTSHYAVGAVATLDGRIIASGYNGTPSGMPHCDDGGCIRLANGKHAFLLHAEENVVASAARLGVSLRGSTLYATHLPCSHCAAVLVSAGVRLIIYAANELTDDEWDATLAVLKTAGVDHIDFKGVLQ